MILLLIGCIEFVLVISSDPLFRSIDLSADSMFGKCCLTCTLIYTFPVPTTLLTCFHSYHNGSNHHGAFCELSCMKL